MEEKSGRINTRDLWVRLFKAPSVTGYLTEQEEQLPAFADYIKQCCESRGEKPEQIIRRSDIDSSFGHRLFAGKRNPSRDTVLQLAFGFGMNVEQTQQLLKVARASLLHPKVRRDAVIAWCLHNGKTIIQAQEILHDCKLPLMGGDRNG